VERIGERIIGAAIAVHRVLGPGFLERIYAEALCLELHAQGIPFERERSVSVIYRDVAVGGHKIDLVVEDAVIVELKAVGRLDPIHEATLISYLRTSKIRLGLLINFNEKLLKDGIKRIVV
jgi:GxxExxY protein